jgi:hypothetical protein
MLGNGDGTFTFSALLDSSGETTLGDFNGDGKLDVAEATFHEGVAVFLGNGDGTFGPGTSFMAGNFSVYITAGDFNGDGKPDLAVANADSDNITILTNTTP